MDEQSEVLTTSSEEYPNELLPKHTYKLCMSTNEVINHFVSRQSLTDELYDSEDELLVDCLVQDNRIRDVFGLSCNLYSNYGIGHFTYKVIDKELNSSWTSKYDCAVRNDQFSIGEHKKILFFAANKLHNKTAPYTKNIQVDRGQKLEDFAATCNLIHKPTKCNYWHFEVHFIDNEQKLIKYTGSEWQKNLASFLSKSFFFKAYHGDIPPEMFLAENCYLD
jgi:hypothetical protein